MKRLHILTLVAVALAALTFHYKKPGGTVAAGEGRVVPVEWMARESATGIPPADRRPADQTFLTFPEWYLVYGPEEQANYFAEKTSTSFPFMDQVGSLWSSYGIVYDQIKDDFEFNTGYHVMIMVIAVSSTAEFGMKAWYETVVGRLTDPADMTQEDVFNAQFTRDYVEFIKVRPWYEYNFKDKLNELWITTDIFGPNVIRKWERKYILTSELVVKIGYGWLIGLGTATAYETAKPNTIVEVTRLPYDFKGNEIEIIKLDTAKISTLSVLRYAAFKDAARSLSTAGSEFATIAGNNSALLITIVVPESWAYDPAVGNDYVELFQQRITRPSGPPVKRVAIVTRVSSLSKVLRTQEGSFVEHIYDY
jgi:hypothetical protein